MGTACCGVDISVLKPGLAHRTRASSLQYRTVTRAIASPQRKLIAATTVQLTRTEAGPGQTRATWSKRTKENGGRVHTCGQERPREVITQLEFPPAARMTSAV